MYRDNLLTSSPHGFLILNRSFIKELGVNSAILLCELITEYNYWQEQGRLNEAGLFWSTIENIENQIGFKKDLQARCLNDLSALGLVDTIRLGMPAKRYIDIHWDNLAEFLAQLDAQPTPKTPSTTATHQFSAKPQTRKPPKKPALVQSAAMPQTSFRHNRKQDNGSAVNKSSPKPKQILISNSNKFSEKEKEGPSPIKGIALTYLDIDFDSCPDLLLWLEQQDIAAVEMVIAAAGQIEPITWLKTQMAQAQPPGERAEPESARTVFQSRIRNNIGCELLTVTQPG